VENAVGAHLLNHLAQAMWEVTYWRERDDEIDYVVRSPQGVCGIEVKSGRPARSLHGLGRFATGIRRRVCWWWGRGESRSMSSSPVRRKICYWASPHGGCCRRFDAQSVQAWQQPATSLAEQHYSDRLNMEAAAAGSMPNRFKPGSSPLRAWPSNITRTGS